VYSGYGNRTHARLARGGAAPTPLTRLDFSKNDKTHRSLVALPAEKRLSS
jgi:hypothetical protein